MASIGGVPEFEGAWPSGRGGRRDMPQALSGALVLVHVLFAVTIVGGLGLLLTATSYDVLDGGVLALLAYAAAPGTLGWWLARRSWEGGVRVWRGLVAVQVWLIVSGVANLVAGSAHGATQLVLPVLVLCFLLRSESRRWYELPELERAERRPFSLARMIRWRRDEGQTAVEYAGLVAIVAAIITALLLTGLGGQIYGGIQNQVCKVTGMGCAGPSGGGSGVRAGDRHDGGTTGQTNGGTTAGNNGNGDGQDNPDQKTPDTPDTQDNQATN